MSDLAYLASSLVPGKVSSTTPILNKGTVNTVFVVDSSQGKFVVRLNNEDPVSRFEKEKWCIEKASEKGVFVPKVISVGVKDSHSYTVMEFIEGTVGDEADTIQRPLIWREIGRYARKIHSIPVAGFGLEYADMIEGDSEKHW